MRKIALITISLIFILCGCQTTNEIDNNTSNEIANPDHSLNMLKTGIDDLKNEEFCPLEISYLDSEYLHTSEYFSNRILELMLRNEERESIEKADEYQVTLKFKGYKNIYVNIENENFWFEDSDTSYNFDGISELWNRYIIKVSNYEFKYCEFEKTVINEINEDVDSNGIKDQVLLYYDNDLRLRVNDAEFVIRENVKSFELGAGKEYYSGRIKEIAHLEFIKELDILLYSYDGMTIHGPFSNLEFFKYSDDTINKLQYEEACKIDNIDLDKGIISLNFLPSNIEHQIRMNEDEIEKSKAIKSELDIDESIEEIYEEDLMNSTLITMNSALFTDYDDDNELELIVKGNIETKFGGAYVNIYENIALVYELYPYEIKCTEILFESDQNENRNYF
jgi:hypothetical protein